jgi:hypothetical protein
MTAPSVGIKDLLVAAGVGYYETPSGNLPPIVISTMPDKPDTAICIYDSGGLAPDPRWLLNFPGATVQVRSLDYLTAYNTIIACRVALLGKYPGTVNGDGWYSITAVGDIGNMGRDQKNRIKLSTNYRLIILPAQATGDNRSPL